MRTHLLGTDRLQQVQKNAESFREIANETTNLIGMVSNYAKKHEHQVSPEFLQLCEDFKK